MSMLATDFKSLFTINFKKRTDDFTDQYSRIFMVKILLACTIITGLSWYHDNLNCVLPSHQDGGGLAGFVSQTCWIQGVFIYKQLRHKREDSAYYGIPKDLDHDGLVQGHLCSTSDKFHGVNEICEPMESTYYLQYQWMPFYICALAMFYYLPHIFHKNINFDLISLKNDVKDKNCDSKKIFQYYFQHSKRGNFVRHARVMANLVIKMAYFFINVAAFVCTDSLLLGNFASYGVRWAEWTKETNVDKYDYRGKNDVARPANDLLPPFGFCEVYSAAKDKKHSFGDKHKMLCEISQFVLYQYAFILLWFAMVIGIILSLIGLLLKLVHYGYNVGVKHRKLKKLTFRQREYLEYIRVKDVILYGEILTKIKEENPYLNHNGVTMELPFYKKNHQQESQSLDKPDSQYII